MSHHRGYAKMSDAISLLGFYLAMVALLSSTFFTKLESWYSDVQAAAALWSIFPKENPVLQELKEHQKRALGLQSAFPWRGFVLVVLFLALITIFGALLGCHVTSPFVPLTFVFVPGVVFEVLFFVGSILFLWLGKRQVDGLLEDIKRRL
jgi:uncharacterized membrane protein (DUF485 family)